MIHNPFSSKPAGRQPMTNKKLDDLIRQITSDVVGQVGNWQFLICLLYTSPSPRDRTRSRMPSSA